MQRRCQNCIDIDNVFICVKLEKKKTLVASFRQGKSTTTSFTHRNAPFPVKEQRIDRIAQFSLPRALWMHGSKSYIELRIMKSSGAMVLAVINVILAIA